MSNQLVELKSLVMTSKDNNEIVERLKTFLEKQQKEKRVNWQMLACYLDGKIFEFIQANKDNELVMKFATELVEGTFYRPLMSDVGYGGTRFFPLHFTLHAILIKWGLPPLAAGYLLTLFAMFLMFSRSVSGRRGGRNSYLSKFEYKFVFNLDENF